MKPIELRSLLLILNQSAPDDSNVRYESLVDELSELEETIATDVTLEVWLNYLESKNLTDLWFELINTVRNIPVKPTALHFLMRRWVRSLPADGYTFYGTPHNDIPFFHLMFLDNLIEAEDEILASMQANAAQGKDIFINPNSEHSAQFSPEAQRLIRLNPVCAAFIAEHEAEQQRLLNIELPDSFYSALHAYLIQLHSIGQRSDPWAFHTPDQIDACQEAKITFFTTLERDCAADIIKALEHKNIHYRRRGADTDDSISFMTVAHGAGAYDCILTQQILLWSMLRHGLAESDARRSVPEVLRSHPQADPFDLGPQALHQANAEVIIIDIIAAPGGFAALFSGPAVIRRPSPQEVLAGINAQLANNPRSEHLLIRRAQLHRRTDNLAAAFQDLDQVLTINPRNIAALELRGELHRLEDNLALAVNDFSRVLAINPDNTFALAGRGYIHIDQGHLIEATRDLSRVVTLEPHNDLAVRGLTALTEFFSLTRGFAP